MKKNSLSELESYGQSIWLDFLSRGSLLDGMLKNWITMDGVGGVTSNPSIFEKAMIQTDDYDESIQRLAARGKTPGEIYRQLMVEDIQAAADLFKTVYDELDGRDGFVSLEVSPRLAHDTTATVAEARGYWSEVNRPNLMIKVPATKAGLPAITQLIGEGINVNITLLFGLPRYREVAAAYLDGLDILRANRKPLNHAASVASFFLSRIDTLLDPTIEALRLKGGKKSEVAAGLHGQAAIASAKLAYQIYQEIFDGPRFQALKKAGARPQRLLWASTSTKNPNYSDIKYIEPLIGRDTINTMPIETLEAYRDHGEPALRLEEGVEEAYQVFDRLADAGIEIDAATQQLEDEGVEKFNTALAKLFAGLSRKALAVKTKS